MIEPNENIGKNITHYRKERKLSKAKLASIVGMDPNHLYLIEAGHRYPQICILARIAAGLGVSIEELVGQS
ncbi:MAG TPA: helix-turn-helix transcriptional regulator [Desulfosporosinus sp.]|nr:helix-turn-helix transcriptional regulator [Desulfosporosinus sp.]